MIFISYREADEPHLVRTLYKRLSKLLKKYKIYFDKNDIVGGDHFRTAIAKQITDSKIVIAPIGPRWLSLLKERQEKESRNPKDMGSVDWLAWELEIALSAYPKKTVIPVYLHKDINITSKQLPERLRDLASRTIHTIHTDNDEVIEDGIRKLALAIRKHIQSYEEPSPSIWSRIAVYLFHFEERMWSVATFVGNSLLERYGLLRPHTEIIAWIRNLPLDLFVAISPIVLCVRFYLIENAAWASKLGLVTGNIVALLAGTVVALVIPYAPINLAVYLQNQDEGLPRPMYRTLRGLIGAAIVLEMPIIYFVIWQLNRNDRVPWLDQIWNVFAQR